MKLCIHNARLVTPAGERAGGIVVNHDGRIESVLDGRERASAVTVIDAGGRLLFPGFIDAHVHMRDPGPTHKEDFASGTAAAACAGVTTVMCMPNTKPPVDSVQGFEAARAAGTGRSRVDFTLQAAVNRENVDALPALWAAGVSSFESLLSDAPEADRIDDPALLLDVLRRVAELRAVVGLYTGSQPIVSEAIERLRRSGRTDFRAFEEARPPVAEAMGIAAVVEAALATGARVVFRQVCTRRGFALLQQAKRAGAPGQFAVEVTPHHLHLDVGVLERMGGFAQMIPPLRPAADRDAAVAALAEGTVDFVGSDHAPHSVEEKLAGGDPWTLPGGTPGLDTIGPALLDLACRGRIPFARVAACLGEAPARLFGLAGRKGSLQTGADGDLVLVDRDAERVVGPDLIRSKAGRSPFEGLRLRGWPVLTVLRGEVIAEGGKPVGEPLGRFVARAA